VSTTLQRQSGRDMAADPRVSLLVVDPVDTARFIQIRGEAELVSEGAVQHLDALTRRYTGRPRYEGFVRPTGRQRPEERVIAIIHARRITLDAIHA
jgi:hypothetical protein